MSPKEIKSADAPNVQLAAKAEPLGAGPINVGMVEIAPIPDEAAQRAGFYYEDVNLLLNLYGDRFKRIVEKGA